MQQHFRKSELILEQISIVLTVNVDNALALVEINNVDTSVTNDGCDVKVLPDGVTVGLDSDELDEVIIQLQQASDALKRAEKRI